MKKEAGIPPGTLALRALTMHYEYVCNLRSYANQYDEEMPYDDSCWSRLMKLRRTRELAAVQSGCLPAEEIECVDSEFCNSQHDKRRIHRTRESSQVAMSYWFMGAQGIVHKFYALQYNPLIKCHPFQLHRIGEKSSN